MEIEYKKGIRRIYAKEKGGDILLVIPFPKKDDEKTLKIWMELVEKLEKKLAKKKKVELITDTSVLLFWEYIPKEELPKFTTEKKWTQFFKQELFDYSNPILQEMANNLGFKDIPIRYICTGEQITDICKFEADKFADSLVSMWEQNNKIIRLKL